jgi:hypothetical protein
MCPILKLARKCASESIIRTEEDCSKLDKHSGGRSLDHAAFFYFFVVLILSNLIGRNLSNIQNIVNWTELR